MRFDLVAIGDTPDAWAAAEEAALLGRSVAVLRPATDSRGGGLAAVLAAYDGDLQDRGPALLPVARISRDGVEHHGRVADLLSPRELCDGAVRDRERAVARLGRELGIRSWRGPVRLTGANSAEVFADGVGLAVEADLLLIAAGTAAHRPRGLALDRRQVFLPEDVPRLDAAPGRLIVLGGNRTALACAALFEEVGSAVTVIDACPDGGDAPPAGLTFGDVLDLQRNRDEIVVRLTDGREFAGDALLFAAGRIGATASLALSAASLDADEGGRLWCDDDGRTWVPSVVAAGEVVGFPQKLRADRDAARRIVSLEFDGVPVRRLDPPARPGRAPSTRKVPLPLSARRVAAAPAFRVVGFEEE